MGCGELGLAREGLSWTRTGLNMGWDGRGSAGHGLVWTWAGLLMGCAGHEQDWLWPGMATSNFDIFKIFKIPFSKFAKI
jgi:hypothetical protein